MFNRPENERHSCVPSAADATAAANDETYGAHGLDGSQDLKGHVDHLGPDALAGQHADQVRTTEWRPGLGYRRAQERRLGFRAHIPSRV